MELQFREARPKLKGAILEATYREPEGTPAVPRHDKAALEEYRECLNEYMEELAAIKAAAKEAGNSSDAHSRRVNSAKYAAEKIDARLNELGSKEALEMAAKDIREKITAGEAAAKERDTKRRELQSQLTKADSSLEILKEQAQRLAALKGTCPTCQQPIVDGFKKELLDDLRARHDKMRDEAAKHKKIYEKLNQGEFDNIGQLRADLSLAEKLLIEATQLWERREAAVEAYEAALKEKVAAGQPLDPAKVAELEGGIARGRKMIAELEFVLAEESKRRSCNLRREQLEKDLEYAEHIVAVLGPKGEIRKRLIGGGIGDFLAVVNPIATGLGMPTIDIQLEPWQIRAGGRPAIMLSESELYRLSIAFAAAFAKLSKLGILCLDGADILDADNRALLPVALEAAGLDQAIIAATGDLPEVIAADGEWAYYLVSKNEGVSSVRMVGVPQGAAN